MHRFRNAALLAAALAAPAVQAMYLNPDGLGQALIYPYYTVKPVDSNVYNTYISIVNHTSDAKVLRVRFRESLNGREVGNYNLYLGPRDAWAGAITPSVAGAPPAAGLLTIDNSCTNPAFTPPAGGSALTGFAFSSASYTGTNSDGMGDTMERTREGYVEVIEMATLTGASAAQATPGANGVPPDCAALRGGGVLSLGPPTGGVSGTLTLINVASGLDFTVNAIAIADLSTQGFYRTYSDAYPDFNSAEVNGVGNFAANGKAYRTTWNSGVEALNAILMRSTVDNEFILDNTTQSAADFVVTLPTKRFHVLVPGQGTGPFTNTVLAGSRSLNFTLEYRSREGLGGIIVPACGFTCPPSNSEANLQLPFASTVVGITRGATATGAAGTTLALGANGWRVTLPTTAENGSVMLGFVAGGFSSPPTISFPAQTTRLSDGQVLNENLVMEGLPAVGFAVRTLRNGTLVCAGGGCQGNYGGAYPHTSRHVFR
ncbi:hypothetical protein [Usitatibacter palustris]|uniref:Uncharacterized protein n=1 Tax=Usitatibacter palustris TaxID=2732487 RepID=A0A6M4H8S0_9PROT|nr:hypothetical protein [Usitatibacter palustris]QJR15990.1 hypothetical protein DSM104440_02818 [Usitatibacter palustris]